MLHPVEFDELKQDAGMKEELSGRTAGAVTLALGMAKILTTLPGMKSLMAYLYHFLIMFEVLFILTLLETGTRVARFIVEEAIGQFRPGASDRSEHGSSKWPLNIAASVAVCFCWGYLLYTGNIDRLWRMMGIANQLLATIGLAVGTTYLLLHAPKRVYALCTAIPFVLVVASVFTAGILSIGMWWQEIGLLKDRLASLERRPSGRGSPPASLFRELTCLMAAAMLALSAVVVVDSLRRWYLVLRAPSTQQVELVGRWHDCGGNPGRMPTQRDRWRPAVSWKNIFARKDLEALLAEAAGEHRLHRVLGPWSLTALGVGCIIGAGIFVVTGRAAALDAGPGVILSYAIAGVGCALAALCYAEFAAMAPVAGSAYTYAYTTLGEIFAWIIGWDLILEYAMGCATVASAWTNYFNELLEALDCRRCPTAYAIRPGPPKIRRPG